MSVDAPARTRPTVVAAPEPEQAPRPRPTRRRWRGRLGIQSKLLAMLLAVSVLSVLVTGFFGQNVPYPGFGQLSGFIVSSGIIVVAAIVLYVLLKARRWL